jgi:hypothetical protein
MNDKALKLQIVLVTASLALVGFFLEVGPVGGAFGLAVGGRPVLVGLTLGLQGFAFLPYLALAMSAAVGLHMGEDEPRPEPEDEDRRPTKPGQADAKPAPRARVRPDLFQLRMIVTAILGFVALKGMSLALAWPTAVGLGVTPATLTRTVTFGLAFTAIGWFILWHLLRWIAAQQQWVRLRDELVGVDAQRVLAGAIAIKPVWFLLTGATAAVLLGVIGALSIALFLAVGAAAVALALAVPARPRDTVVALGGISLLIVALTIALAAAGG